MTTAVAETIRKTQISRPLKVLVPLIQEVLIAGNEAGMEYYRRVGEMLIEARGQVAAGSWSRWLSKNFELSRNTASKYMRLARLDGIGADTIEEALGERPRRARHAVWNKVRDAADRVEVKMLTGSPQSHDTEIVLHRKLAQELINLGYRALATRLHPDRGGSRDAMARLNVVRDELKDIAATRRFV